ncbi:LytTR family transcriptional regulator [Sporosarcina sp. ACRSL]|uniref:LytTR family DNA-binding domain-containing protein n=1 Tax=Sporosarcina sp. ACRSL TaxID=2918215 RepID=UPI001EF49F50|nr:LytTR family DNA-binding domain-containing protein [Sporosarcina sp. ACRSL]MCG7344275.1 LytTR family transcriptional regulator [Sporosarcina sp. ACRSL]
MEKTVPREELLQQFSCLLGDWIPKDARLVIAFNGYYLHCLPGHDDHKWIDGQPVQAGSIAATVLKQREKTGVMIDPTLYGNETYAIGYPIDINGEPAALVVILPPAYETAKSAPLRLLTGKLDDEWYPVPVEQITHIESFQKKTFFYTECGQFSISNTLKELEKRLPEIFLRIHRSYIVNTSCIQRISRDFSSNLVVTLTDGTELPVSQSYVNEVKCVLGF